MGGVDVGVTVADGALLEDTPVLDWRIPTPLDVAVVDEAAVRLSLYVMNWACWFMICCCILFDVCLLIIA